MANVDRSNRLIHIIDDEAVIARTLAYILQRSGYRVEFFSCAEQALAAGAEERPDLIVTDVVLDGMTGIQLAEKVAHACPGLPVLLISGQAHTSDLVREAAARGFHFHVHPKPMHPEVLLQEVAKMLSTAAPSCDALVV